MPNNKQSTITGIDFNKSSIAAVTLVDSNGAIQLYEHGDNLGQPYPDIVGIDKRSGEVITGSNAILVRKNENEEYVFFSSLCNAMELDSCYEIAGKKWTPMDLAIESLTGLRNQINKRNRKWQQRKAPWERVWMF